ncbi:MAG: metallophosphoesterase [Eubacteriales bacterium]|nr:metallophosphoesterase [Eubacteriales bacterium]
MRVLVIPDVHLKPWMFQRAGELLRNGVAEQAVCLMDLPDDWDQSYNIDLYIQTYDAAIAFSREFSNTVWIYGNHDLSYLWGQLETGFSRVCAPTVRAKMKELERTLSEGNSMCYLHRIDQVLFSHGGLRESFVKFVCPDSYDQVDEMVQRINDLGSDDMWQDDSCIWHRPQYSKEALYRPEEFLQVVGHTPVESIRRDCNVLSCDVFSTDRGRRPIGTQKFPVLDTKSWEYEEY